MQVEEFQLRVTRVALGVAAGYGFALGGGQALRAYGLVRRPTEDIDLMTDGPCRLSAVADRVCAALVADGLSAETPLGPELDFLTSGEDFAELEVWDDEVAVRSA